MSVLGKDIYYNIYNLEKEDLKYVRKFKCGNKQIDKFFRDDALNDTRTVTKVVWRRNENDDIDTKLDKDNSDIIAMYSLSCSGMFHDINDKKYLIPAIEIRYFAMNEKYQNLSYSDDTEEGVFSDYILLKIIAQIREITEAELGADKIILFSVPDATRFYERNLFERIEYKNIDLLRYLKGSVPMVFNLEYW